MVAKILLVDADPNIVTVNSTMLRMEGYEVFTAETIEHSKELLQFHNIDLMVLDVLLPDGDGMSYCKEVTAKYDVEILLLSALDSNENIIKGLRAGADDYLTKPYDLEVLLARIEARLRHNSKLKSHTLSYSTLTLNMDSMTAYIRGEDILLTKKEFAVLLTLVNNANHVVNKRDIYENVWGTPMKEDSKALWTVISRLKKKLNSESSGIGISLLRSEGYILEQV